MLKQIVIISGKGGTGKTTIAAAFAALSEHKVMVDCDVDAADLHLLLKPIIKHREVFKAGFSFFIEKNKCIQCGKCKELCRFDAISKDFVIDPISCEGCSFCKWICPTSAIDTKERIRGEWFLSTTRFGPLIHAKLNIAEQNSGKLVTLVRNKAKQLAEQKGYSWIIIDGAPGIGCPVIASLSGVDYALVITEPTLSGLHDADRVIKVAKHFNVYSNVVINKYDLNLNITRKIEKYCEKNNIELIGKVSFDKSVVNAMVKSKTIIEYRNSVAKEEINNIWNRLKKMSVN